MNTKFLRLISCVTVAAVCLCGCSSNQSDTAPQESESSIIEAADPIEEARNEVIARWENEAGVSGTGKFIEDTYKQYPDDEVITNIYFYSVAKQEYDYFVEFNRESYLESAIEYAAKIDPDYSGVFSDEMHEFVSSLIPAEALESEHNEASAQQERYNSLTNSEKKEICNYIQGRYDYYDKLSGGYSGDKYSDTIMEEASEKYGLSVSQIEIIWMNMYSY